METVQHLSQGLNTVNGVSTFISPPDQGCRVCAGDVISENIQSLGMDGWRNGGTSYLSTPNHKLSFKHNSKVVETGFTDKSLAHQIDPHFQHTRNWSATSHPTRHKFTDPTTALDW